MKCPKCGKTGRVEIAGAQYCTNCGTPLGGDVPAGPKKMTDLSQGSPAAPAETPPKPEPVSPRPASNFHGPTQVLDLSKMDPSAAGSAGPNVVDTSPPPPPPPIPTPAPIMTAPEPVAPATPAPVATPPSPAPTPIPAPVPTPMPTPTAPPQPDTAATPITPVISDAATPAQPPVITPSPSVVAASNAATQTTLSPAITGSRKEARLANASETVKSDAIQKFVAPAAEPTPAPVPQPAPVANPATPVADAQPATTDVAAPQPTPSPINAPVVPISTEEEIVITAPQPTAPVPTQPAAAMPVSPFPAPQPVAPQPAGPVAIDVNTQPPLPNPATAEPAAAVAAPQISSVMPPAVGTTVQANQQLITPQTLAQADPETARKQAFALAMANAPKTTSLGSVAAAVACIAIIGGFIWHQNEPKLAIHTAGSKAGFEVSLPSFVPNTYALEKPISSSPGRIALQYNAADNKGLTITQQKTDWDSGSLYDNFVATQASDPLVIKEKGLTIYLYNGNVATWVNRGIWYTIQGNDQLNREQLLKIAYGL